MLTADHVQVRKKDGELVLRAMDARARAEAEGLASSYLDAATAHVGRTREELAAAWIEIDAAAKKRKVAAGLKKLVDDACVYETAPEGDPVALRRLLFEKATAARRAGAFDREALVRDAAASLSRSPQDVERSLFADLRGEHVLAAAPTANAASIVEAYELGQAQAVLLRAVRVTCDVNAATPGALRSFFAWLKFQKLLFTVERSTAGDGAFRVVLDGPFSMFESVAKYGLRLALVLPALRTLDDWSLTADVRWGKDREPFVFRLASLRDRKGPRPPASAAAATPTDLPDEVRALLTGLATATKQGSPWRAEPDATLLDHPGVGVCIPDLVLRREGSPPVYVEVLGFWSRDAVWKRIELAERGLGARIVFCASARLRVSAEVLASDAPAALYVYKGRMSARALLEHVDRVAAAPYAPSSCTSPSPEHRVESVKRSPAST